MKTSELLVRDRSGTSPTTNRRNAQRRFTRTIAALGVLLSAGLVTGLAAPAHATTANAPGRAEATAEVAQNPLFKIVYESTIFELVPQGDRVAPVALTYEKWRDVYNFQSPSPASTDFVKYPWSPTVYAVTFWPGGEDAWMWTPLSYPQWEAAGDPSPRIAGWITGSYFYKWITSAELFVEGADGVNHKLSYEEWANSGFRNYTYRSDEGFMKLSWAPEIARILSLATGAARAITYSEWQEEGFPTPNAVQRTGDDMFYQACGSADVWYAGPAMNRRVTFQEWQGAGSPTPTPCLH